MGTEKTNLEKYLELWNLFEQEISNSKKLSPHNNLSGFARYYEKHSDSSESNDYERVYDRLKKMQKRKSSLKSIRENTLIELQEYFRVLKKDFFVQELLDDEKIEHWFD